MTEKIDLHMHSTASDGTLAPAELVDRVAQQGIDLFALTDHDTTAGLAEAERAARALGLCFVPGVEVSVTWESRVVHIVGLGVDAENDLLQQGLLRLREFRHWRAGEIARRLEKAGIRGALEGAETYAGGGLIGRTHFARFLVERGHAPDMKRVFKRFLVRGKPGHVPGEWATLEEAVQWIHSAGGVAVIAHPARYPFTRNKLRGLLGQFAQLGGEALEVVSSSHSRDEVFIMARLAREFGLQGSVGSDFHDPEVQWVRLGEAMELPSGVSPVWTRWFRHGGFSRACSF